MLKLNLQLFAQEKTEQPTAKKKQEAREKGQVAKSQEVPGALVLLFVFLAFLLFGGFFKDKLFALFTVGLTEYIQWSVTEENVVVMFQQLIMECLLFLLPIFIIAVAFGIVGNYAQIGVLFTGEPLKPQFKKLNPIEGAKRIFSIRALVEFAKSIAKMMAIGLIVFLTLWNEKENILSLSQLSLEHILSYTANLVVTLGLQIGLLFLFIAFLDLLYQRYDHEKNLRMSKQDIKDEHKKSEGDPLVKSKIRDKQRQMAMMRMMQEVPYADVVITNPTHFAIAIRYDAEEMEAPIVLAKGADYIAYRIREKAKEHDIAVMENKALARALYEQVDIGQAIPADLFQAVAEILAYVYKLKEMNP